jgi:hypothetical protein
VLEKLKKPRTTNLLWLALLVLGTACVSHFVATTHWQRLLSTRDDDFSGVWSRFCEELEKAGASVEFYSPDDDDLDRAEGYRFLTRMLRLALAVELEHHDPLRPVLFESETATRKFGGNNPDELYYEAHIDGRNRYRVHGHRGTTPLIEFTVYDGRIGSDERSAHVAHLTEAELEVAEDGSFEVILSPEAGSGNWLRTTPESKILFIRQYRLDWERDQPAHLAIELDPPNDAAPPPFGMAELSRKLEQTARFVAGNAELWPRYSAMASVVTTNRFLSPMTQDSESDPGDTQMPQGHTLQPGAFEIAEDEALLIEFTPPPELPYWGFSLLNRWYESLDYRYSTVHANHLTARTRKNGSVRLVVAHSDPGVPNWIDTTGHRFGTMLLRWTRPTPETHYPEVQTRLVKLTSLSSAPN